MIDSTEIRARALRLGLLPSHVEKDYALNHLLAALADLGVGLIFRGGTALARIYWPDFRLSEDLDFLTAGRGADLDGPIRAAVETVGERAGLRLRLDLGRIKEGWSRSTVRWSEGQVVLDVSVGERAYVPAARRNLVLPYSDLGDREREIRVLALAEILGDKWYMLDDRREPRDLFDLWAGLCKFEVPFEQVAEGYRAKHGALPSVWRLDRAKTLKADWELRLRHQVANLPDFDAAYAAVRGKFEEWRQDPPCRRRLPDRRPEDG